jgi:PAS domain-containing protein
LTIATEPGLEHIAIGESLSAFERVLQGSSATLFDDSTLSNVTGRLLAARELLARPGFMTLRAVRDGAHVVDFVWDFASSAAARLLGHDATELVGKHLLDAIGGPHGAAAVFDRYRCVVESGAAETITQVHLVHGNEDNYRHSAVRLGDGVAVTLTNLSAVQRTQVLRREISAQRAMATKNVGPRRHPPITPKGPQHVSHPT